MIGSRRMGDPGSESELEGRLVWVQVDVGSKSERRVPTLLEADGSQTVLYVVGDHPVENQSLVKLEGRGVHVRGRWRGGVLRVEPEDLQTRDAAPSDGQGGDA